MSKPEPTPAASQSFPSIVVSWLMLRFVLALVVLIGSANRPETALEKDIAVWPPASSFGRWLDRVLVRPWQRWDTEYYLNIAERGYRLDDGSTQFHPLYPWMGRVFGDVLGGNMLLGLLAASSVCGLLFLMGFERLARLDLSPGTSRRAAVYLLHAPLAFVLFAPYTEALFLLSSVIVFLMARRRAWWMAGTAAGLAALTRQQGIFLLIPLAWELWEWSGRDWRKVLGNWRSALSLALAPAGLLVWLVYRAVVLADIAFDAYRPQTWIYGLLISTGATRVIPEQGFVAPWRALGAAFSHPRPTTVVDLILAGIFVLMFVWGGRSLWRLRPSYFLYSAAVLLVSFSYFTGSFQPYMGLPRHCFLAFPLFLPVASWAERRNVDVPIILLGLAGMVLLALFYSTHGVWVP